MANIYLYKYDFTVAKTTQSKVRLRSWNLILRQKVQDVWGWKGEGKVYTFYFFLSDFASPANLHFCTWLDFQLPYIFMSHVLMSQTVGSRKDIFNLFTSVGFSHLGSHAKDDIFVRLPRGGKSPRIGWPKDWYLGSASSQGWPRTNWRTIVTSTTWGETLILQTTLLLIPRDFLAHFSPDAIYLSNTLCPWQGYQDLSRKSEENKSLKT